MRVHPESRYLVALGEAARFKLLIVELVANIGKLHHGRLVAGALEDAAEQHRPVDQGRAGARRDFWDDLMSEIGVRAGEIEQKFNLHHHVSP